MTSTAIASAVFAGPTLAQDTVIDQGDILVDGAPAITVQLDQGDIQVTAANVATTGDDAPAVDLSTLDGEVVLITSGTVGTNGTNSQAVATYASDDIRLGFAGDVLTLGDNAYALTASSIDGDISIEVSGQVATSGVASSAVGLLTENGDITLNLGTLMTLGSGSAGVDATSFSGRVSVLADAIVTTGDFSSAVGLGGDVVDLVVTDRIATGGRYATGIGATGRVVTLGFTDLSTAGEFAVGLSAVATDGLLTILGGNALTMGDHAEALEARANNGAMSIQLDSVETRGLDSSGLSLVLSNSDLTASIDSISVAQNSDAGLHVETDGGVVDVTVGTVDVAGFGTQGILVDVDTLAPQPGRRHASIDVTATQITTSGEAGYGLNVDISNADEGGSVAGGDINLSVGEITTSGDTASGIRLIDTAGRGRADIVVGDVTTQGVYAYGVVASVGSGDLTLTATGRVSTQGASADGIRLVSTGDILATADQIETSGYGAEGLHLTNRRASSATGERPLIRGVVQSVRTTGRHASAVYAYGRNAGVGLHVGYAETLGSQSHGVRGSSTNGNVVILTEGLVETHGTFANGVYGHSVEGSVSLVTNDVRVHGYRSVGVAASSWEGGELFVRTTGDILATGENSNGVAALSWPLDPSAYEGGTPQVEIFIEKSVVNTGAISEQHPEWDVYGNALAVFGKRNQILIGQDGHLESSHGWSLISLDRLRTGPDGEYMTAGEDYVFLAGSIAGRASLGRGDDTFVLEQTADISALTDVFGGEGTDILGARGWTGSIAQGVFHDFERLNLVDGADLQLSAQNGSAWAFDRIELDNSRLRLGNGVTLTGDIFAGDTAGRSALGFHDTGASESRYVGNITAFNGIALDFQDGFADDRGTLDGNIDGTAYVALDIGIGGGAITATDSLTINGAVEGDVVLWLNPHAAAPGGSAAPLTINGAHGDIVLAGGPLSWGGQIFDLEVNGALPTPGKAETRSYAAGGGTSTARLVSTGFTADGSAALVLPSILEGLDASLFTDRAARRGTTTTGADGAIWLQARTDGFDGAVDGIAFDGDQHAITLGADLFNRSTATGSSSLSLMFHAGEGSTDLTQTLAPASQLDVHTLALGAAFNWADSSSNRYVDLAVWATDREMTSGAFEFEAQGFGSSVELGTHFAVGARSTLHPHAQIIWSGARIDGVVEPVSGSLIKPGDAASLRLRAGATFAHAINETWRFEASAAADHNTRNNGTSVLASGYARQARVSGMAADARMRLTGHWAGWQVFGDVNGRWGGGREAADSLGARIGVSRQF